MSARFVQLELRADSPALAERAAAEAFAAGAAGLEERDGEAGPGTRLTLYLESRNAARVGEALRGLEEPGLAIGAPEPLAEVDWSEAWQAGLRAARISERLAVRPEPVALEPEPGQRVLVIHPGQAFGTGGHASTRLALDGLDRSLAGEAPGVARVLDAGCGSGVLALAALALGARSAVAFDLDPLATRATRTNAARNRLEAGLRVFTGSAAALAPGARFDLVVANLLRRELLPLLTDLAARLAPGGRAVFSGLLESDREPVREALARVGLAILEERREEDGGERWIGLLTRRAGPSASAPAAG